MHHLIGDMSYKSVIRRASATTGWPNAVSGRAGAFAGNACHHAIRLRPIRTTEFRKVGLIRTIPSKWSCGRLPISSGVTSRRVAAKSVRLALDAFYAALSDDQKARFN